MSKIYFIIFLLITLNPLIASELRYVSVDFPPYTFQTPKGGAGAMYDVVVEVAKRMGKPATIEFVPWARARFDAENNPNVAIIPLGRTPERENKYKWVIHILDDAYVIVTLKNSKANISTIESAKNLKIGILSGSVADALLKKAGYTNLEPASTDIQNVKKLKLGRIDAWVAPYSCRGQYEKEGGLGSADLRVGAELTTIHEYLGASKSLDDETIKKWQKTFATMKRDGSYAAIMKKYGFTPLE